MKKLFVLFTRLYHKHIRKYIFFILDKISPRWMLIYRYIESYRRLPNLKDPKLFSEKLYYYFINYYIKDPLTTMCADKVAVRNYISTLGYDNILIKTHGVWTNANDINWEKLPQKFVLKCNHGSGYNIVCTDKNTIDKVQITAQLNSWLKEKYWLRSGEVMYKKILPMILCEEFVESKQGGCPSDYKFFCSYGEVKFLYVASDRASDVKFNFYSPNWVPLPIIGKQHARSSTEIPRPENLEEMIFIAEQLSKKWGLVRIDLYSENNTIYFGEITFFQHGGGQFFSQSSDDAIIGELFSIIKDEHRQ